MSQGLSILAFKKVVMSATVEKAVYEIYKRTLKRVEDDVVRYSADLFLELVAESKPADEAAWEACVQESLELNEDDYSERICAELDHADQGRMKERILASLQKPPQEKQPLEPGTACVARLAVDGEWYDGVVAREVSPGVYTVRITKFGVDQSTPRADIVLADDVVDDGGDDEDAGPGACELCGRVQPLTRHHLMPRSEHARLAKKIPRATLELTCAICRGCHSAVHHAETNASLAAEYCTIEALREHDAVARWARYAATNARLTAWDTAMMRNAAAQRK